MTINEKRCRLRVIYNDMKSHADVMLKALPTYSDCEVESLFRSLDVDSDSDVEVIFPARCEDGEA